jgi:integral membrane protein
MTNIHFFRRLAFLEGLSLIILVFIAMPNKYLGDNPLPVRYVGMIHGVLFILFAFNLLMIHIKFKWTVFFSAKAFISAFVPFGMIYLDKKLKEILT